MHSCGVPANLWVDRDVGAILRFAAFEHAGGFLVHHCASVYASLLTVVSVCAM